MRKKLLTILCFMILLIFTGSLLGIEESIEGKWEGWASTPDNVDVSFSMTFKTEAEKLTGLISIPDQGTYDAPLDNVVFDGETLTCSFSIAEGSITCTAKLNEDGSISGTYQMDMQSGTFNMKRAK